MKRSRIIVHRLLSYLDLRIGVAVVSTSLGCFLLHKGTYSVGYLLSVMSAQYLKNNVLGRHYSEGSK